MNFFVILFSVAFPFYRLVNTLLESLINLTLFWVQFQIRSLNVRPEGQGDHDRLLLAVLDAEQSLLKNKSFGNSEGEDQVCLQLELHLKYCQEYLKQRS
jgi:hypothetical protein